MRAALIRRLFDGSSPSHYFSFLVWPAIVAIYWRQVDFVELAGPFAAHVAIVAGFDVVRRTFIQANPTDDEALRWGRTFAGFSFLAGACLGVAGLVLASKDLEQQGVLLGLVLLAAVTAAVPMRSAHPPAFYGFALATTLPVLFVLLSTGDPSAQFAAGAGGAYLGYLMVYVRDIHRRQCEAEALAWQKDALLHRLQAACDAAQRARVEAVDARRKAEKASEANSTFFATIGHEIRTPMSGVLGMIDVLERTRLCDDQRRALGTVRYSASTLLRVVDDILDFSRIDTGRLDLERREFSTAELIEGAADALLPLARAKGLQLSARVAPGVPGRVMGDRVRLQQILFNLLGNAIKFTDRGTVQVILECIDGPMHRISVSDTGIGLSSDQRERLFQPFVQGDTSISRRFGGTGLGLFIVRRLAEAMGGGVTVESEPGAGSTFVVTVRLDNAGSSAASPSTGCALVKTEPLGVGGRVLVVDDNAVNRKIVSRQLELAGVQADTAGAGDEALTLWRERRYDLVLADLQMPDMDGFELARRIRAGEAAERRARTPILALTADKTEQQAARSREAGMDGCLGKPICVEQLRETLDVWLNGARG